MDVPKRIKMRNIEQIDKKQYAEIVKVMPITSIDIAVINKGNVLLVKRNNIPAKSLWWLPGGRIRKWESPMDTAKRELFEETGIDTSDLKFIGTKSVLFREEDFHFLVFIFAVYLENTPEINLDDESSEYKWSPFTDPAIELIIREELLQVFSEKE